jgi:hypothetical protein
VRASQAIIRGRALARGLRWRGYRLRFCGFRHLYGEDGHGRGGAGGEKGGTVSEVIDDYAGSQPARGGTDPLGRGGSALGQ